MDSTSHLGAAIRCYARHVGCAPSTASRWASGSGATLARVEAGRGITIDRAARIMQWLSDHWPPGAEWPPDVPRPAPSPDAAPNPPPGGRDGRADGVCSSSAGRPPGGDLPTDLLARRGIAVHAGNPNPSPAPAGPAVIPPAGHSGAARGGTSPPAPRAGDGASSPAPMPAGGRARLRGASSARPGAFPGTEAGASLQHREGEAQGGAAAAPGPGRADLPPDADPVAEVELRRRELVELMGETPFDAGRARAVEEAMLRAATALGPDGTIRSPRALLLALGVRRYVYDDVVRRCAEPRPAGTRPARTRPGSDCHRVRVALAAAGDRRFAGRAIA